MTGAPQIPNFASRKSRSHDEEHLVSSKAVSRLPKKAVIDDEILSMTALDIYDRVLKGDYDVNGWYRLILDNIKDIWYVASLALYLCAFTAGGQLKFLQRCSSLADL